MKLKKRIASLVLTLLCTHSLFAQFSAEEQAQIDSLSLVVKSKSVHDTSVAYAYICLSELLASSNLDTVIYLCTKAQQISEKNLAAHPNQQIAKSFKSTLAAALNNIGYVYMNKTNNALALDYYQKSIDVEIANGNKKGTASAYNNMGLIYYDQGDIPLALEYYHKSLKIKEEFNDQKGMAMSFNNIGYVHAEQGDKALALDYYNKSLKIQEKIGNKKGMALSYNNMGLIYFKEGNYDLALNYYKQSLKKKEEIGDKKGIANSYQNIAKVYTKQHHEDLALDYVQKGLALRQEIGDKEGEAYSYFELGNLLLHKGNTAEAYTYAAKGLKLGNEIGFPDVIEKNAELLSKIAIQQGNWKEAYQMHNTALQMHDSLASEASLKAAANQQAKYTYEKAKANSDIEQAKKDVIAKEEKQKQTIIIYAIAFGLVLVLAFLFVLYKRFKVTQRQNSIIHKQKSVIEEKHKEITDSINYAERIQRSFLATKELLDENLTEYFVFFKPKDIVSGDFYWASKLNNGNFALVTADSTGHGVPGSIMSLLNSMSLEKAIETHTEPSEILNASRRIIINRLKKDGTTEGGKDGMDASITVYDFAHNKLIVAAANNPVWIIRSVSSSLSVRAESRIEHRYELIEIKPDKMPVGKHDKQDVSFTQQEITLQQGDLIYTLTDGFPDQFGGEHSKKFMSKHLKEVLLANAHLPMAQQKVVLDTTFANWRGSLEQVDDVCVIGVRV